MKKLASIVLSVSVTSALLMGCGQTTVIQDVPAQTENQNSPANTNRQGNFQRADLMGEIESVSGNTIKLKVIEMPNFQGNGNRERGDNGNMPKPSRQPDTEARRSSDPQNRVRPTPKYTGETKSITIPEGIKVTKMVRTTNGNETQSVALSELKVGETLQAWYSDKEKGTISRISLRPQGMGNQNRQQGKRFNGDNSKDNTSSAPTK